MLQIKDNDALILSLKGIEQFHYHKDQMSSHKAWLIEIINTEHDFDKIIRAMLTYKVEPTELDSLVDDHYVIIVNRDRLSDEKLLINEQFLMQQTISRNSNWGETTSKFDAYDFVRSDKKMESYVDKIDVNDITIMPNKVGNDSMYSTGANTHEKSHTGSGSVSTKTPEAKAFEEIKEILNKAIKETFSLKAYVYTYQLNKIQNISELNLFFSKISTQIEKAKGEEYHEELLNKIRTVHLTYGI